MNLIGNKKFSNIEIKNDNKSIIQSVCKAYDILELFIENNNLSFSEINTKVNMTTPTLYRFLATLIHCGLLDCNRKTKIYSLGPNILLLGNKAMNSFDIVRIAQPFMEDLKDKTHETISLFVRRDLQKICIAKVESDQSIRYSSKIGEPSYLHGGASGNVLMSDMTKEELDTLEHKIGFSKLTNYTVTDRQKINDALKQTRENGYWVSYKERREDTAGIGVPIFDHTGRVIASLNITLPSSRFDKKKIPGWVEQLKKAGQNISKKAGYESHKS